MPNITEKDYNKVRTILENEKAQKDELTESAQTIIEQFKSNTDKTESLSFALLMFDGLNSESIQKLIVDSHNLEKDGRILIENLLTIMELKYPDDFKVFNEGNKGYVASFMDDATRKDRLETITLIDNTNKAKLKKISKLCTDYKKHLESPKMYTSSPELFGKKYNFISAITTYIGNDQNNSSMKLIEITDAWATMKNDSDDTLLESHRSGAFERLLQNIAHILSLGLYSKATKGTFQFWKSHGKVFNENMASELSKPETNQGKQPK